MFDIRISQNYLSVLSQYLKFIRTRKTQEVLFFKKDDKVYLSKMDEGVWISISASEDNISFGTDEIGIVNLSELLKYLNNINYPVEPNSSIVCKTATSNKRGIDIPCYIISGRGCIYHLPVANIAACFTEKYDRRIPRTGDDDTMTQLSVFNMNSDDIKMFTDNIKLLGTPPVFSLSLDDNSVKLYLRGESRQQMQYQIDELKRKTTSNFIKPDGTEDPGNRLFSTELFTAAGYFGCDFQYQVRTSEGKVNAIKSYGRIETEGHSPIDIVITNLENKAHAASDTFDILK